MSKQLEDILRKAMFTVGTALESVIGKAKTVKAQAGARAGVQPILSVESLMDVGRLRSIIEAISKPVLESSIPELKDRFVLEVGEGAAHLGPKFMSHQARAAFYAEVGLGCPLRAGESTRGWTLRAKPSELPFRASTFSFAVARLATQNQGDVKKALVELGRVLIPGGRGVFVDFHPFGLYTKRGPGRVRPAESVIGGLEDYYHAFRSAGLRVMDVRESFIDDSSRKHFSEEEVSAYRQLKGTPLLVFLFFYKPREK